jgi:hypothetical protein
MQDAVYLFYIDDSGDPGLPKKDGSPTDAFVLASLIVEDSNWLTTLDEIVGFRRFLRDQFGLRLRDELKAGYLVHGTGPFGKLKTSHEARMRIYRMALRLQPKIGSFNTWAIVIDKHEWEGQGKAGDSETIRERAWRHTIQRIERFTHYGNDRCVLFPDEGYPDFVRKMIRRMRRFGPVYSAYERGESLAREAKLIVEDPNFRKSWESYFIQLADLNAYAAHRAVYPEDYFDGSYWELLGDTRVKEVSKLRPGHPRGISVWP